jgi:hypothetical protein
MPVSPQIAAVVNEGRKRLRGLVSTVNVRWPAAWIKGTWCELECLNDEGVAICTFSEIKTNLHEYTIGRPDASSASPIAL